MMNLIFFSHRVDALHAIISSLFRQIRAPTLNQKEMIEQSFFAPVKAFEGQRLPGDESLSLMKELEQTREKVDKEHSRFTFLLFQGEMQP